MSDLIQCSMNSRLYSDPSAGIWDDGEWISWDWINEHLEERELMAQYPGAALEVIQAFEALVGAAIQYHSATGRHLEIWGELGEVYAEIKHGLKRNRQHAPGSDGRIGNDHCEVKTISPRKSDPVVQVKRSGNFNKLIIVRIDDDYNFSSCVLDRKSLGKGNGKYARAKWAPETTPDA
jgi:hypothetical protein